MTSVKCVAALANRTLCHLVIPELIKITISQMESAMGNYKIIYTCCVCVILEHWNVLLCERFFSYHLKLKLFNVLCTVMF